MDARRFLMKMAPGLRVLTEKSETWEHQWRRKGSQPGFSVKQTCQFLIAKSMDDGKTWSEPVNITRMGKKQKWWLYATGSRTWYHP